MRAWWRSILSADRSRDRQIDDIRRFQDEYAQLGDEALNAAGRSRSSKAEVFAVVAVVASRVLGLDMFDAQLHGALALTDGQVVEMQTGEGKTLAAVPAVVWHVRSGQRVHVLLVNDYLARRDAEWMGQIYERLGVSVGVVQQDMSQEARRSAYRRDVTYATANEVGFDYLRDQLARRPGDQVLQPFSAAVVDEADSILIDEARLPLVIAGGGAVSPDDAHRADAAVRGLTAQTHFAVEPRARTVALTPVGVRAVERAVGCTNLFDAHRIALYSAVQDALHAHVVLQRDVDYVLHNDAVLTIDEFKGRIARERRWPAGLQTALELKEEVTPKPQGRVLGSVTMENLVGMYPTVCGMTGTAATQTEELQSVYGLGVTVIAPNRPVLRIDLPDRVFETRAEKERAVAEEIRRVHASGRPVLVGTASVEESERLSAKIGDLSHDVLNARHEESEAAIIAGAGDRGAVTISTNMAGRGVDIALGPGVIELGGLCVVGMNRHESRRIDNQLRGRAGRQGDPGSSQFFVSREDPLMVRYAEQDTDVDAGFRFSPDTVQRIAEGHTLDVRLFLRRYESVLESQRLAILARRREALHGAQSERERLVILSVIDDHWSDYLAAAVECRSDTVWVSLGAGNPFGTYLKQLDTMFWQLNEAIETEVAMRLAQPAVGGVSDAQRGETWTYLTVDEPFGAMTERVMRGLLRTVTRTRNGGSSPR
jgi:preprotein translocase subunit SecA